MDRVSGRVAADVLGGRAMKTEGEPMKKSAGKSTARKNTETFSEAEREAMKERAAEAKRSKTGKQDGEADLLAKIAEMPEPDRSMAERLHAIVRAAAPSLKPKTWYGMPAWADDQGKAVCFFTPAVKFKERYASFGFNANAKLDDGNMWPTSFALLKLDEAEEKRISALLKKAAG